MESFNIAIIMFKWDMMYLVFVVDRILSLPIIPNPQIILSFVKMMRYHSCDYVTQI